MAHHIDIEVIRISSKRVNIEASTQTVSGNHRMRITCHPPADYCHTNAPHRTQAFAPTCHGRSANPQKSLECGWNPSRHRQYQQTLVFRVFGASGIRLSIASGVCARRAGTRTVAGARLIVVVQLGERILSLANHRLPRLGETLVVRPSRGECLVGLRIRPTRDALFGTGGRARQLLRGLVLQHFREKTNAGGENQHRRKHTQAMDLPTSARRSRISSDIGRLGERRRNVGAHILRLAASRPATRASSQNACHQFKPP